MTATGNTLDDFPAGAFTILLRMLHCSACGSREASIRIVYTGAGGFEYGGRRPPG